MKKKKKYDNESLFKEELCPSKKVVWLIVIFFIVCLIVGVFLFCKEEEIPLEDGFMMGLLISVFMFFIEKFSTLRNRAIKQNLRAQRFWDSENSLELFMESDEEHELEIVKLQAEIKSRDNTIKLKDKKIEDQAEQNNELFQYKQEAKKPYFEIYYEVTRRYALYCFEERLFELFDIQKYNKDQNYKKFIDLNAEIMNGYIESGHDTARLKKDFERLRKSGASGTSGASAPVLMRERTNIKPIDKDEAR